MNKFTDSSLNYGKNEFVIFERSMFAVVIPFAKVILDSTNFCKVWKERRLLNNVYVSIE